MKRDDKSIAIFMLSGIGTVTLFFAHLMHYGNIYATTLLSNKIAVVTFEIFFINICMFLFLDQKYFGDHKDKEKLVGDLRECTVDWVQKLFVTSYTLLAPLMGVCLGALLFSLSAGR